MRTLSSISSGLVALTCMILLLLNLTASAQLPPPTRDQLNASATHAVKGVVLNNYIRTERKDNWEYTFGVAELDVKQVTKGQDILARDRVFVRYWRKAWLGDPDLIPDSNLGNDNIPSKGDTVEMYLMGNRQIGFDAFTPNGFFLVTPPQKRD